MIDIALLREQPEQLQDFIERRGMTLDVAEMARIDESVRRLRREAEGVRAEQKASGKEIAQLEGDQRDAAIARAGQLAEEYKRLTAEADEAEERLNALWIQVPNIVHDSVPDGTSDDDNLEIKRWGEPRAVDFERRDHQDLGEQLGIIDLEAGAKVSGSRFAYLKGQAVFLEFALVRWALDLLASEGFTPVVPPVLVREAALFGTGFFPEAREQVYAVEADDLYLVGTAEVPLAAMHMDEILSEDDLPLRYAGFSTCFRREAGTYGKDTRGIFRVHQFDKVEMFAFVHPDESWAEHDYLFSLEERIVQALELPYRVVNVAAGDLGAPAAKKYDIEAWIPSQNAYREITSCSNTTDFQARRLKIRFKTEDGNRFVHTLNGTALAVGRTLLAIMENFQAADGTVSVPEVLRPYAGFDRLGG